MTTAHVDTFARDDLPPRDAWPDLIFTLPELQYPERLNAAAALLDGRFAQRPVHPRRRTDAGPTPSCASAPTASPHVLVEDMGVVPGNRVLLRGAEHTRCWRRAGSRSLKAGAIAVATMPLLRARELTKVIDKAQVTHALCDARLADELDAARAACPTLARVALFARLPPRPRARWRAQAGAVRRRRHGRRRRRAASRSRRARPAQPKGTMHFHRDVLAICDCWPRARAARRRPTTSSPAARRWRSRSGWAGCCCSRCASARRRCCSRRRRPTRCWTAIAEHGATVLFTAPTSYRAMPRTAAHAELRELAAQVRVGRRGAARGDVASAWKERPASRSSTASARPRCCTSSSPRRRAHARPGCDRQAGAGLPGARGGRRRAAGAARARSAGSRSRPDRLPLPRRPAPGAATSRDGWNYTGDAYLHGRGRLLLVTRRAPTT